MSRGDNYLDTRRPRDRGSASTAVKDLIGGHVCLAIDFRDEQLFVRDDGLLVQPRLEGFAWTGFPPMVGTAVLLGVTRDDESGRPVDVSRTLREVGSLISWMSAAEARRELMRLQDAEAQRLREEGINFTEISW